MTEQIKNSFAFQLVKFLFFFSAIIFALMFVVNSMMTKRVMLKNAEQVAHSLTLENVNKIEGILSNIGNESEGIAYLISKGMLTGDVRQEYIRRVLQKHNEVRAVSIYYTPQYLAQHKGLQSVTEYKTGTSLAAQASMMSPAEYSIEDWFLIPIAKQQSYWSEPWVDTQISTESITSYSVPVSEAGVVIGVVRLDISLKVLQQIVSSVHLLNSGYAILITGNGTFVTHPADSLVLNYTIFSYAEQVGLPKLREIGKKMVAGESGFVKLPDSKQYKSRWIYYYPVRLNKWSFGVKFSNADIMGDLYQVNAIFRIILVMGLLLLLLSIYIRITSIFKPLRLLLKATNKIGSGDFSVHLPETEMDNEVSQLTESFARMQSELKTYTENLIKTTREKDKIAAEIKFAAQIQQRIIPSNQNLLTNIKEVSIYGILEPAEDIGGDLYDAFMIDERYLCFAIADVFGKGIVASMLMTMVQTLIRSQSRYSSSAVSLMQEVNSYLCQNNKQGNFITLIIGILDLKTGIVDFCNAGHTPIYLKRSNEQCIRFGETHTTALGMFEDLKIDSSVIPLDISDLLVLFTDGVSEAMSESEQFFGLERLEGIISSMQNPTPEGMAKSIIQEVRKFTGQARQNDDLSILVLKFNHPKT